MCNHKKQKTVTKVVKIKSDVYKLVLKYCLGCRAQTGWSYK